MAEKLTQSERDVLRLLLLRAMPNKFDARDSRVIELMRLYLKIARMK